MPNRNFRRSSTASGLSNLADGVFQITLPLVALGITRDPAAFASVTLVGRLPVAAVRAPGRRAGRPLDRRRTMMLVDVGRAMLIGGLAVVVAVELESCGLLYVVAFVLGVGETMFDTAAQSILPTSSTDPTSSATANGRLYAVELTANQFVGPPLGGLIAGVRRSLARSPASAVAYVAGSGNAAAARRASSGRSAPGRPTRLRTDIAEGVRYLARHRLLRALAICVGVSNLASTAMIAVLPLYAIEPGPVGLTGPASACC